MMKKWAKIIIIVIIVLVSLYMVPKILFGPARVLTTVHVNTLER